MMKICYLANAASIHTKRWAKAMVDKGCDVEVISFDAADIDNIKVHYIKPVKREMNRLPSDPKNMSYIVKVPVLRNILKSIKPDIVHAHYATGYGFAGALCGYHPYVISTWGTDIFQAPRKSIIFKNIVKYNLKKADYITATSRALTDETKLYTDKSVYTIPFGIDTTKFCRLEDKPKNMITIGIVKSLEEVYGIKYLIEAFADVSKVYKNIRLLIVGGGGLYEELNILCKKLGIQESVTFTGKVTNDEVPKYLNMMDIFVMPSMMESFGVAALEAAACELPVVASDVGGIPEVIIDNHTGFLVKPQDSNLISQKIKILIENEELRNNMGKNGRKFVDDNYNWQTNINDMYNLYCKILNKL